METNYYLNTYKTEPLTERILQLIRGAQTYIKTGNFFFRESKIKEEVINACRRGVVVFILSNLQEDERRKEADNDFSKKEYDPHISNLMDFVEAGAHVRCISELHAKFLITDGQQGMIMSSNYTVDSLGGNPECGADLEPDDVGYLEGVFDTIYEHADIHLEGRTRNKNKYILKFSDNPVDPDAFASTSTDVLLTLGAKRQRDGGVDETNFADCRIRDIYHAIADIINEAQQYVYLASWSFKKLDKLPLIRDAITNAARRGVKVTLIFNKDTETSGDEIKMLRNKAPSIDYFDIPKIHAKFLLTEQEGIIFTANIDGNAGLLSGFELGVYLNETQYNQALEGLNTLNNELENN